MIVTDLPVDGMDLHATMMELEGRLIIQALVRAQGSRAGAARLLKLNRTTLVQKMRKHGLPLNPPVDHLRQRRGGVA